MKSKLGIQGDIGSACEMAALYFEKQQGLEATEFVYLHNAAAVIQALRNRKVDNAVMALESPLGAPIEETEKAFSDYAPLIVAEANLPVNHSVLGVKVLPFEQYTAIYSHPVAIKKHSAFLREHFPSANLCTSQDSGGAARALATGELDETSVVIAMPSACDSYNLKIVLERLPDNEGYLTRFLLLGSSDI